MLPQFGYVFAQAGADRNGHNPPLHPYHSDSNQKYQQQPHVQERFTPPPPNPSYRDSQRDERYYEHMTPSYSSQQQPPPPSSAYPQYSQVDPYQNHTESYRGSETPYYNHVSMKVYNHMDEPMYRYDEYQRWHPENDSYNQHSYHDQRQQYGQDWSDDDMDIVESRLSRKVREYGERLAWLDKDFEDAKEDIYRERLRNLQEELQAIQEGTHAAFQEVVRDLEEMRDKAISDAKAFGDYQLECVQKQYVLDSEAVEEEYQFEKQNLHDMMMAAIAEKKKQIVEDRDDIGERSSDLVRETAYRSASKRNLRKRTAAGLDLQDRRSQGYSSRGDTPRRRAAADRSSTPLRLDAPITGKEDEELENEFLQLKGMTTPANKKSNSAGANRR
ncbi:Sds3-like-domain-containing protein [Umbelopsis sp. PMI_123]|nr:Sds3-like-domain-containing protein [Umbelopsis sp. PMI_123]